MGVLSLYTYIQSKGLGNRKSWTRSNAASAGEGKGGCPGTKLERHFIIDGNAFIHHLYCGRLDFLWGGQYSAFVVLLEGQIRALTAAGFELEFLFDGPLPLQKQQTRVNRDTEKIAKIKRVLMVDLGDQKWNRSHGHHHHTSSSRWSNSSSPAPKSSPTATVMGQEPGSLHGLDGSNSNTVAGYTRSMSSFLIPPLVMEVTLQTLRRLKVKMMVCEGEADGLVARIARERSQSPFVQEAYAISKDSDYFIFNTGSEGKGGYIPLDYFEVLTDAGTTHVSATVYTQSTIAANLGILPWFMPLFASLTGNDYIRPEEFESQIWTTLRSSTSASSTCSTSTPFSSTSSSNQHFARIKATAAYLKLYGASSDVSASLGHDRISSEDQDLQIQSVIKRILKDRSAGDSSITQETLDELGRSLEASVAQYRATPSASAFESTLTTSTLTSRAEEGLSGSVRQKEAFRSGLFSFKLMDIVCHQNFWCTPFLENQETESAWLTSREIRRWIYGILARSMSRSPEMLSRKRSEEPMQVTEYVRRGDHLAAEIVEAVTENELHRATKTAMSSQALDSVTLMDIDTSNDDEPLQSFEENDLSSRTQLFLNILGANTQQVKSLPKEYLFLAATLRCLIYSLAHSKTRSASISMANFEVVAFVGTALVTAENFGPYRISGSSRDPGTTAMTPEYINEDEAERPALTKRALQLSAQFQHMVSTVAMLANALHLEDIVPELAGIFDGLTFHRILALARGGTFGDPKHQRQHPESKAMMHRLLDAVEESLVETGEIDEVVVYKERQALENSYLHAPPPEPEFVDSMISRLDEDDDSNDSNLSTPISSTTPGSATPTIDDALQHSASVLLSIPNAITSSLSTSSASASPPTLPSAAPTSNAASTSGVKQSKRSGISKKAPSSKRRGANSKSGTSSGNGGSNMFSVLSLGCEF